MAVIKGSTNQIKYKEMNLFKDYPYFHENFYDKIRYSIAEFLQKDVCFRFMSIADKENILSFGHDYFVNKISINKNSDFTVKISDGVVAYFLNMALGESERKFDLNALTDIEAMLIKSLTVFIYGKIEHNLNREDVSKKILQRSKNCSITIFVRNKQEHVGQIIVSFPDYMLPTRKELQLKETFSIGDFETAIVPLNIGVGKSRLSLNDVKQIEDGDLIILEDSDITTMSVLQDSQEIGFKIEPNPSLIIKVDNNGGDAVEEENIEKPQNMWDTILVDVVAEFDNVKLTLGDLKQISEGLVVDVGSVYDNKINLRVENQVVASGELVIINDRYGVRIDSVKKAKDSAKAVKKAAKNNDSEEKPKKQPAEGENSTEEAPKEGDENFDYSDFEIEDESI